MNSAWWQDNKAVKCTNSCPQLPNSWPTDRWPTSGCIHTLWKMSNGQNSATRLPIPFLFGSRVGFSGTAPFLFGPNPRWRPATILKNFKRRAPGTKCLRGSICRPAGLYTDCK